MKKFTLLTIALIMASQHATFCQYGNLDRDSLRAIVFNHDLPDSIRLDASGMLLTYSFIYVMPDSALYYARILYDESIKADYSSGIVYYKVAQGWSYSMMGQKNEALKYYLAALEPAEKDGRPQVLAFLYSEIGTGYMELMMLDKGCEYTLQAMKLYKVANDPENEIRCMSNLASAYLRTGHHDKAEEMCRRVITLADSLSLDLPADKANAYRILGQLCQDTDPAEAIRCFNQALNLFKQDNNMDYYHNTLFSVATFLLKDTGNLYGKEIGDDRKSIDIALSCLEQTESWAREMQDSSAISQSQIESAKAYLIKGEKKKALEKAGEAEKLHFKDTDLDSRISYTNTLSFIYKDCGEYEKALNYLIEYASLKDSINYVKQAEKVSQLTESFEIGKMEDQLTFKEQQLAKNRVITYLFIGISALILILAAVVFYFLRQKQKAARLLKQQNLEIEKARYRAEQSEKFKERFLASMSHEIRTPLNAVIGMTDLLLDDPQPSKTETFLKNIKQAGEHLTGIINQILDLSRIDAGKLELHEAPFSMKELLDEMGNLLGSRAKEKELQLIIHKGEGTPDWFCGDAGRIRQVLLNLTGNALKFTEQGSVQIKIAADESKDGKVMVHFSVEDTGIGIPKELQAVIFEEFVQAGQSEDQQVIGTGLGLSIARKLVERMGGTLSLESEPGKGSAFSFTILLALSTEEAYQALQKEKELTDMIMKGSFRILVVEDNPSNQIVTEGLLEKILPESRVILVEDGFRALTLLEKEKFDLVLMDIRMPGMDGYETTRRLRQLKNENAAIPVIALTASVIRSDIQHCLESGMNGYVPKPVSRAYLAKILHEHLKIVAEESVFKQGPDMENFLAGIFNRPAWSDRLYDVCNGKKDRFIKYLAAFLAQSEEEVGKWQDWMDQHQYEPLAFSIHKLLPYIREFMDDKHISLAVVLDQELRKGWAESYSENLLLLKQEILTLHKEALNLQLRVDSSTS